MHRSTSQYSFRTGVAGEDPWAQDCDTLDAEDVAPSLQRRARKRDKCAHPQYRLSHFGTQPQACLNKMQGMVARGVVVAAVGLLCGCIPAQGSHPRFRSMTSKDITESGIDAARFVA